ncbi:condensation domain-containing protein [[Clostridium] aminophilum]|uniref:condensation domain-containing protein n=1 Tax=[Clostridium] aminophilum TaxID=1526 RepID=UPI0033349B9D
MEKYEISSLTMMMAMTHYFGQTREDKATMNIPFVMHLKGEFDKKKLEDALQKILSTKIMNTWFSVEDNRFYANEKEYVPYVLEDEDVEGDTLEEKLQKVAEIAKELTVQPLALFEKDQRQYFFKVYNLQEDYHILYMSVHHAFLDFGSIMIALKSLYSVYSGGEVLFEGSSEFSKFMGEEIEFLKSEGAAHEDAYWAKELQGAKPVNFSKLPVQTRTDINPDDLMIIFEKSELKEMAEKFRTSVFNIMMLIAHMAIAKTNDSNDTMTQYAISNRPDAEYRYTLGCITRMLTNRAIFDDDMTVGELNKLMRKKIGDGYQNRHVAGKTPLGSIPYVVAYEDLDDLDVLPYFNGEPVQMDYVHIARTMEFLCILLIPIGFDKLSIGVITDVARFGEHAETFLRNAQLAFRFLKNHPDRTFGDYMRQDVTLDTMELLDQEEGYELIAI